LGVSSHIAGLPASSSLVVVTMLPGSDYLDASPVDAGCSFFFIDCFDRIVSQFL
jgi:hypothetical protein